MSKKVSQEQLRKLMGSKLKKKPTKEPFIYKIAVIIIFPKSIANTNRELFQEFGSRL